MKLAFQIKFPEIKKYGPVLKKITTWVCHALNLKINSISVIFINNGEIRKLHKKFLKKSVSTDIITFDLGEDNNIEGEIYINLDKAKIQAKNYQVSLMNEISRLIIHGCLHLAGYDDNNHKNRKIMKLKEDNYVKKIEQLFISEQKITGKLIHGKNNQL